MKVVDSRTFKVADKISAVEVEVEVGGMRYILSLQLIRSFLLIFIYPRELHVRITSVLQNYLTHPSGSVASNTARMELLHVCHLVCSVTPLTFFWRHFSSGEARVTVFASSSNAHTFSFQVIFLFCLRFLILTITLRRVISDTFLLHLVDSTRLSRYKRSWLHEGHYVENTGNTTLKFLEVFKSSKLCQCDAMACFLPCLRLVPGHITDTVVGPDTTRTCQSTPRVLLRDYCEV